METLTTGSAPKSAEFSNDLRHTIAVNNSTVNAKVTIRLNDECKNGHQDFSITGSFWEVGKVRSDRNSIIMGACHDTILQHFPELQIFVNLHLADYTGVPMYAVENGFYHLQNGFNNTKPNAPTFKAEFCEYYRLTAEQFDTLSQSENKLRYALNLEKLGIIAQWKEEADKAIKLMEEFTGKKFVVDSVKKQYTPVTAEQASEEAQKEQSGYYTPKAIEQRKNKAKQAASVKIVAELLAERDKDIKKANDEYNVKMAVHNAGLSLDNFIYYNHTNQGCFNWHTSSYNAEVTQEEFNHFMSVVNKAALPDGITFKLKEGKN